MKYVDEFRDGALAQHFIARLLMLDRDEATCCTNPPATDAAITLGQAWAAIQLQNTP